MKTVNVNQFKFMEVAPREFSVIDERIGIMVATVYFDKEEKYKVEISPAQFFAALAQSQPITHVLTYDSIEDIEPVPYYSKFSLYFDELKAALNKFIPMYRQSNQDKQKYLLTATLVVQNQAGKPNRYCAKWKKLLPPETELVKDLFEFFSDGSLAVEMTAKVNDVTKKERRLIYYFFAELALEVLDKDSPNEVFNAIDCAMRDVMNGKQSYLSKGDFTVGYSIEKCKKETTKQDA